MIELIVARYKENIGWLSNINPSIKITVYNKYEESGQTLPNIGREGHTYLHHIINNYDNLSDFNIFLQGDPSFHDSTILDKINKFNPNDKNIFPIFFGPSSIENMHSIFCPSHINGLPMYYFFDLLFGIKSNRNTKLKFYPGAQFLVDKKTILNRPKEFYQFLIKFLSYEIDPIEGYIVERLWPYIFDNNIQLTDKYKLFI